MATHSLLSCCTEAKGAGELPPLPSLSAPSIASICPSASGPDGKRAVSGRDVVKGLLHLGEDASSLEPGRLGEVVLLISEDCRDVLTLRCSLVRMEMAPATTLEART